MAQEAVGRLVLGEPIRSHPNSRNPTRYRLSIIIPTKNRQTDLLRCLTALERQTETIFDVLVLNNGSPVYYDGPLEIEIMDRKETNLTFLFNLGWKLRESEVIAYLNDDSEPEETWVKSLLECFRLHAEAAAVGGPTIDMRPRRIFTMYQGAKSSSILRLSVTFYERALLKGNINDIGRVSDIGTYALGGSMPQSMSLTSDIDVDCLTITNCAFKRDVLERLGGFDESFRYNHADGDFFARMKRNGLTMVFSPTVVVYHHVNPSGPVRNPAAQGRDFALYYFKNFRPKGLKVTIRFFAQVTILMTFWVREACLSGQLAYLSAVTSFVSATPGAIANRHNQSKA